MRLRKFWTTLGRSRKEVQTTVAVVAWGSAIALFAAELDGWRPGVPWVQITGAVAITVTSVKAVDRATARITRTVARPTAVRWLIPTQRTATAATYMSGDPTLTNLDGPTMRIAPVRAGQYDTVETRKDHSGDGEQLPPGAWADAYKLGRLAERRDLQRRATPGA